MLVIRFQRKGKRNQPFFKIVVTDKRKSSTGGRFVEDVGFYNPVTKNKSLKAERIKYWISKGVKPSPTVFNLLLGEKILEGKKIPVPIRKKKKEKEAAKEAPAAAKEAKPAEVTEAPKEAKAAEEAKPAEAAAKPAPAAEVKPEAPKS